MLLSNKRVRLCKGFSVDEVKKTGMPLRGRFDKSTKVEIAVDPTREESLYEGNAK